jgi:hypothetical protein
MDRLEEELLITGLDDWVHLADIAWAAKSAGARTKHHEVDLAISAVRSLMDAGLMQIGDVSDGGFFEWGLPLEEALERLRRGWLALDHDPWPGDVCWLSNTQEGNREAKNILQRREGTARA